MQEFAVERRGQDAEQIEAILAGLGLAITLRTSLRAYPGCVHWHLKTPGKNGTLELTLDQERLWFKITANREADWMPIAMERFRAEIESPS